MLLIYNNHITVLPAGWGKNRKGNWMPWFFFPVNQSRNCTNALPICRCGISTSLPVTLRRSRGWERGVKVPQAVGRGPWESGADRGLGTGAGCAGGKCEAVSLTSVSTFKTSKLLLQKIRPDRFLIFWHAVTARGRTKIVAWVTGRRNMKSLCPSTFTYCFLLTSTCKRSTSTQEEKLYLRCLVHITGVRTQRCRMIKVTSAVSFLAAAWWHSRDPLTTHPLLSHRGKQ